VVIYQAKLFDGLPPCISPSAVEAARRPSLQLQKLAAWKRGCCSAGPSLGSQEKH